MHFTRRAASLLLLGSLGCGGDPDSSISLVTVKGTVTLNGKPMGNALVSFVPDPGNKAGTAGGDTTGPEGNYLARFRNRSGLSPGKYKVTITPGAASAPGPASASEAFQDDPFMAAEGVRAASASKSSSKNQEIKGLFDVEVSESATTLDFDVKATATAAGSVGSRSGR